MVVDLLTQEEEQAIIRTQKIQGKIPGLLIQSIFLQYFDAGYTIIGLPRKDGIRKPLFDYEGILYKALIQPGYLNSDPALHSNDPRNILHALKEKGDQKTLGMLLSPFGDLLHTSILYCFNIL